MIRRQLHVAVRGNDQQADIAELAGQETQKQDGRRIRRLQILEDEDCLLLAPDAAQERSRGIEQLEASSV